MSVEYKKGYLVKHPKIDDWGVGVVLEDSDGKIVNVSFKNAGKKSLSLQYVDGTQSTRNATEDKKRDPHKPEQKTP
jgi:hypothetical protein